MPPLRRLLPRLALLLVATLPVGCRAIFDPDFDEGSYGFAEVEVDHLDNRSPAGEASAGGQLIVRARFRPGVDRDRNMRAVADDTLRVLGLTAVPRATYHGERVYELVAPMTREEYLARSPDVQLPQLRGLTATVLRLSRGAVASPDTIVLEGGATEVRIAMTAVTPGEQPRMTSRQWHASGSGAVGSAVRLTGDGTPPAVLALPTLYLTFVAGHSAVFIEQRREGYLPGTTGGGVAVRVRVLERARRVVRQLP